MKKTTLAIILTSAIIAGTTPEPVRAATLSTRVAAGTYTGAGKITTKDGHIWKVTRKAGRKMTKKQRLLVIFDTNGTRRKTDDKIVSVYKLASCKGSVKKWRIVF